MQTATLGNLYTNTTIPAGGAAGHSTASADLTAANGWVPHVIRGPEIIGTDISDGATDYNLLSVPPLPASADTAVDFPIGTLMAETRTYNLDAAPVETWADLGIVRGADGTDVVIAEIADGVTPYDNVDTDAATNTATTVSTQTPTRGTLMVQLRTTALDGSTSETWVSPGVSEAYIQTHMGDGAGNGTLGHLYVSTTLPATNVEHPVTDADLATPPSGLTTGGLLRTSRFIGAMAPTAFPGELYVTTNLGVTDVSGIDCKRHCHCGRLEDTRSAPVRFSQYHRDGRCRRPNGLHRCSLEPRS